VKLFLIGGVMAALLVLLAAASERPRIGWDPFTTPHSIDGHQWTFVDCGESDRC
jgi:hypothetical protein